MIECKKVLCAWIRVGRGKRHRRDWMVGRGPLTKHLEQTIRQEVT